MRRVSTPIDVPVRRSSDAVTVRFWAGARAAAGRDHVDVDAATLGQVRADLLAWRPALAEVLAVSSLLVDGLTVTEDEAVLVTGSVVEVLPPFAGG